MENGLTVASREGTPQGGPLSPLLSNILLDDLDKELEGRGCNLGRFIEQDLNPILRGRGNYLVPPPTRFLSRLKMARSCFAAKLQCHLDMK